MFYTPKHRLSHLHNPLRLNLLLKTLKARSVLSPTFTVILLFQGPLFCQKASLYEVLIKCILLVQADSVHELEFLFSTYGIL